MARQKTLTPKQISTQVFKQLKKLAKFSFLEQVDYFLGKCQLLEFALKNLLSSKHGLDPEKMEKWTLGRTINELKKKKVRADLIALLEELLEFRNYVAHDILVDHMVILSIVGNKPNRLVIKRLDHALFQVEQSIIVYDFLSERGLLDPKF